MNLFQGLHADIAGGITQKTPGRIIALSHGENKQNTAFNHLPSPTK